MMKTPRHPALNDTVKKRKVVNYSPPIKTVTRADAFSGRYKIVESVFKFYLYTYIKDVHGSKIMYKLLEWFGRSGVIGACATLCKNGDGILTEYFPGECEKLDAVYASIAGGLMLKIGYTVKIRHIDDNNSLITFTAPAFHQLIE